MTEDLRVDTGLVLDSGSKLGTIAGAIPEPPAAFSPPGTDALSTAIANKVAEVVDPVLAQMPAAKEAFTRYAENVVTAARSYDSTDRQIAEEILKRLEAFDESLGGGSAAGGAGSTPAGAAASPAGASGVAGASPPAAGAAQQAGQLGQMAQMPMQLAQQAAQIPMQLAGMAAAIPQAMMQGIQSAVQQAGQAAEMAGTDELEPDDEAKQADEAVEKRPEDRADEAAPDVAAPGNTGGERVPEPQQQDSRPEMPAAPKPAPTRPAESSPEIAL